MGNSTKSYAQNEDGGQWFVLFYECPQCQIEWIDEWSCVCEGECPECGTTDIMPYDHDHVKPDCQCIECTGEVYVKK